MKSDASERREKPHTKIDKWDDFPEHHGGGGYNANFCVVPFFYFAFLCQEKVRGPSLVIFGYILKVPKFK